MQYTKYYRDMSINAEISRKLVISSIDEFFNYIKKKDSFLSEHIEFKLFHDHVFLAKYGCPCTSDENIEEATKIYQNFDKIKPAFEDVKKDIGCTSILFKLNDEDLFEL
jgi:hypothetical protein